MRLALIADTFPPLRTSGAVQLRDLSREFAHQGHEITVILPASNQQDGWKVDDFEGVRILRLRAPQTKDIGYVRRTLAEFWMPFSMGKHLRKSPLAGEKWEGVVWYAPSIFLSPLAKQLMDQSGCRSYLIIRDIFPDWAADMGLMGRGLPYLFFKLVARYQYSVAHTIGIQTPGNSVYFKQWTLRPGRRLEVLQNWLGKPASQPCTIQIESTRLQGRKIFVYAGNMGVAQGVDAMINLATSLKGRADIGFLFVGRGSEVKKIRHAIESRQLDNALIFDEIHPDEIPNLYAQCHVGLVALDPRHKTHNIPGKFLTYMQSGLPVLAQVNPGNDLLALIDDAKVGIGLGNHNPDALLESALALAGEAWSLPEVAARCKALFERQFSAPQAVDQIVAALKPALP